MRGHALLKSHKWFILYDGGIDAEACSRHLGEGACFDSCLSLRHSAQPSVLSWQPIKSSQLKHGGGRLRAISVQRSSLTRPDSGTELVDKWIGSLLSSEDRRKNTQLVNNMYSQSERNVGLVQLYNTYCVFAFVFVLVHYYEIQKPFQVRGKMFCKELA